MKCIKCNGTGKNPKHPIKDCKICKGTGGIKNNNPEITCEVREEMNISIKNPVILRKLRKKTGLSVNELGDMVGVSGGSISYYESGDRSPKLKVLKAMIEILGGKLKFSV